MKSYKSYFGVVALLVASSCGNHSAYDPLENRSDFEELSGNRIFENIKFVFPQKLAMAGNSIIVSDPDEKGMLKVLSLDNDTAVTYLGRMGNGADEFLNMRSVDYRDNDSVLYIHDSARQKSYYYKYNPSSPSLSSDNLIKDVDLKGAALGDTHLVSAGLVSDVVSDPFMFVYTDEEGKVLSHFGEYPGSHEGISESMDFNIAHQTLAVSNGDYVAVAGRTSDWIAFFNLKEKDKLVKEYFSFESPVVVEKEVSGNQEIISMRNGTATKDCYIDLAATPRYVYAVYSGSTEEERREGVALPKCVLKFTLQGEFVKGYTLGEPFGTIAVTPDDSCLIAVTQGDDSEMILKKFYLN